MMHEFAGRKTMSHRVKFLIPHRSMESNVPMVHVVDCRYGLPSMIESILNDNNLSETYIMKDGRFHGFSDTRGTKELLDPGDFNRNEFRNMAIHDQWKDDWPMTEFYWFKVDEKWEYAEMTEDNVAPHLIDMMKRKLFPKI